MYNFFRNSLIVIFILLVIPYYKAGNIFAIENIIVKEKLSVKEKQPAKNSKSIFDKPYKKLKNFSFSEKSELISRVTAPPDIVLNYLREFDNRPDYTSYIPNKNEMKIIEDNLKILPSLNKKVMKKRLIGIYFINNFLGSGFADWVIDENKKIFVFLIFNSSVLKKNISQLITEKEKTNFIMDDKAFNIFLDVGDNYNGLLYILIHESTHLVDYVKRLTPFIEPVVLKINSDYPDKTGYTAGIWAGHKRTLNSYPFRKNVSFYGFGKGAKIKISNAVNIYRGLSMSPFCTLYGSMNWAEDVVEMLTFYHLTEKLKQKFVINVLKNGKVIYSLEPMKTPEVKKRLKHFETFYKE